jgi:hypothetical protein
VRVRAAEDDKGSEGQSNSTNKIISLLLEKLRPEGNLILRFANIKKICELYKGY